MRNEQAIKRLERIVADEPRNHEALHHLGRFYAEADDLKTAITYLEKCVSVSPSYFQGRYELGIVLSRNHAYEQAVKEWQKVTDEDGDFRFGEVDLSHSLSPLAAVRAWERYDMQEVASAYKHFTLGFVFYCLRQLDTAINHYHTAISMKDRFDMAHFFLGLAYADKGDYENALKVYSIELNQRPQASNICYQLGLANFRLGRIQPAVLAYQKAIQFRPRYLKAHYQLAVCYDAQSLFPQGEKYLKMAIDFKPSYGEAHLELGKCYQAQYRMEEAGIEFEQAIRYNPRLKEAHFKLGEIKKMLGKMDEALSLFQRYAELDPADGDIYYYIGSILSQQKRFEDAAKNFMKTLAIIPNHDFALYGLGEALFNAGDNEGAIEVYRRGIMTKPNDIKLRNAMGRALYKQGDMEEAIEQFQMVITENPKDPFAHYYLGLSLFKNNRVEEAVKEYAHSVESNPNSAYAHFCLGASYSKQKEFELARTEFAKGADLMPNSEAELALYGTLQLLATIGIDHAQQGKRVEELYYQLSRVYRETVKALANAIDARDPYTRFHSQRVSRIAKLLATHILRFDPSLSNEIDIETVEMGGLLHDIGKIGIPDFIVRKEAKLTDAEMAWMKKHPDLGVVILKGIEFPWDIIPLVRHHHEKYDGSGYPAGLMGDAIPLMVMIIGISDVYDALVTDRPYRKAFSSEQAMEIIYKGKERDFAEGLVNFFFRIVPDIEPYLVDIAPYRKGITE